MDWPQITYIVLSMLGLGVSLAEHGKKTKTSFPIIFLASAITYFLLIKGGFFG